MLGLNPKAAPQIDHVIGDVEWTTRLEYDAAMKILSPASPLEPKSADLYRDIADPDADIGIHLVKVVGFHKNDIVANDVCDYDLAAISDDRIARVQHSKHCIVGGVAAVQSPYRHDGVDLPGFDLFDDAI